MLSARQTLLSVLCQNETTLGYLHLTPRELREFEVQTLLSTSELARAHDALKENLTIATYLNDLVPTCSKLGVKIDSAARYEGARVLWDQNERQASIRLLQSLAENVQLEKEDFAPSRGVILANLVSGIR